MPNLLQTFPGLVTINAPVPKDSKWAAENLIENLSFRTSGDGYKPLIDIDNRASFESCYKTTQDELSAHGNMMIITLDLQNPMFVHAVLIIQDLFSHHRPEDHKNSNQYLQNLQLYIGNDVDYKKNALCPGGPFMIVGDSNWYTYLPNYDDSTWKYGVEAWCNLEGRYVTIEADLTSLVGDYEMTICNLGVFGTIYERPIAIESPIIFGRNEDSRAILVPRIESTLPIGNELDINLRFKAGTAKPWMSIL